MVFICGHISIYCNQFYIHAAILFYLSAAECPGTQFRPSIVSLDFFIFVIFFSIKSRTNCTYDILLKFSGWVTPAKNQMVCGSCVAFAEVAVMETCMAKAGAPLQGLDLREQYLIDGGYNNEYGFIIFFR